jgi:hypothetical protein
MNSRYIDESVKKRLYAESMGRCMNPSCQRELFCKNGDIIEKAHIDPYCKTADNSFENLVLLCPNCHTEFDKNCAYTPEEVLGWKKTREEELKKMFSKKYTSFEELKKAVVPLLLENQSIFTSYYIGKNKKLWDKFEVTILSNNRKIKTLFSANLNLIQHNQEKVYSNLAYIQAFMRHVDEFEATRADEEKRREVLFPAEIDSMFGIAPVKDSILSLTESLELLIRKLKEQGKFVTIIMGVDRPYIQMQEEGKSIKVYLDDTPRLRQLYYNYNCFRSPKVRLDSLNYALKYIRSRNINFRFLNENNLREIVIHNVKLVFVYEYCLNQSNIIQLSPTENTVIVNLHNWNGHSCISKQAYEIATTMGVKLLTMEEFYGYINQFK